MATRLAHHKLIVALISFVFLLSSACYFFSPFKWLSNPRDADRIFYDKDYYNPFCPSFKWSFRFSGELKSKSRKEVFVIGFREESRNEEWKVPLSPNVDFDLYIYLVENQDNIDAPYGYRVDIKEREGHKKGSYVYYTNDAKWLGMRFNFLTERVLAEKGKKNVLVESVKNGKESMSLRGIAHFGGKGGGGIEISLKIISNETG